MFLLIMSGPEKSINLSLQLRLPYLTITEPAYASNPSVGTPTDDSEMAKFLTGVAENG